MCKKKMHKRIDESIRQEGFGFLKRFYLFIYLREREREGTCTSGVGAGGERERENISSRLH